MRTATVAGALAPAVALALALRAAPLAAQPTLKFYGFTVAGPVSPEGGGAVEWLSFTRTRLMAGASAGPLAIDAAWEQTLLAVTGTPLGLPLLVPGAPRGAGDWLPLDGVLHSDPNSAWRSRMDRASIAGALGPARVVVGRQAISWATTLYLTPADPFAPFDPADPFREYRTGVDAARALFYPGPFAQVDLVVRPADTPDGTTLTALARGVARRGAWDLSTWAGALHDQPAGALGAAVSAWGSAMRFEAELRREPGGNAVFRAAAGADRRVSVLERDLQIAIEYQRDGFGAVSAADLPAVAASAPARRGEMQVLGRDEFAAQARWQVHPLAALELVTLLNIHDGSMLWAPGISLSATEWLSARLGADLGTGPSSPASPPASEYGAAAHFAYLSLSAYF